ncbi:ABC transporter permease [Cohaesibacter gelatinilyticus]|uniref:Peptide/nickel transport system permease protein n=1 Tax=Cohaesibacter gelatinilyticus TaxID=372072 RepID=A0A285PHS2_9HYPH|nr:ABC transporter permease [Cohaesibacter gelatinilyticus]SNZ21265.1 peptide/nickel transport system permease protein [Cohaesibacter gelatinilyticus]
MISSNSDALTTGADVSVPQSDLSRFLKRLGIAIVVVGLAFAAAFLLTPYQPNEANFLMRLKPPSATHWFGTDNLGRDVATRILYGAGWSLGLAFLISGLGAVVGVLVGLSAGSAPRWFDQFLMRITDSFFAFPELIAAIAIAGILGPSTSNMVIALVMVSWMRYARLTRSLTLELSKKDFITQAHLNHLPFRLILWRHYLPNLKLGLLVLWTNMWARTILSISGLSFLGFGVQPPEAEWGAMLLDGKAYMQTAPHLMIFPGLAVLIAVLSLNLIGDQLRDHVEKTS